MRLQGAIKIKNRNARHPWLEYHDALIMKGRLTPICKQIIQEPGAKLAEKVQFTQPPVGAVL
jgi:hypothetical protein